MLNELSTLSSKNIFAPKIYSIEEFTEVVSKLVSIDNITSLFEFYAVYKKITPEKEQENFETFTAWAQTLIHDFNEIDRYLLDQHAFFSYLSEIQDINHWYLQEEKTELVKNYLRFWNQLPQYYEVLKENLLSEQRGYQGLVYRQASANIEEYAKENSKNHVFIGFNALNAAEQKIFQFMLEKDKTKVFWDIDEVFINDTAHGASLFLNQYRKKWPHYSKNPFTWTSSNFSSEKHIEITGVPKNIGQAKYVSEILANSSPEILEKTAVVLGDEGLLLPILNALPPNVESLNITMGFPLKNGPVTSLFDKLFKIHKTSLKEFYYKDVLSVLSNPALHKTLSPHSTSLIQKIRKENLVYITARQIIDHFPEDKLSLLQACFGDWKDIPDDALKHFQVIIQEVKKIMKQDQEPIALEFLYHFHILFNKLENLCSAYPHINGINSLYTFYKEMLNTQNLDFEGKPFKGLQLMGMLESRALDFENIIITSVNEGVLPSGKSNNSFIPYDLKQAYKLPTYKEKDAVYTYHFYRLLQRAKTIHLLYNTEPDGLNSGEKSRFITQLEVERQPLHKIHKKLVTPSVPKILTVLKEVKKTPEILDKIKALAGNGFSPSALTTYMRNPIDFYNQYILGVREQDDVEETIAYNTLGTVVHNTLESFYKPFEGKSISEEDIESFIHQISKEITLQFKKSYTEIPLNRGKNLLIFEVAKRYVRNFLNQELKMAKTGARLKIIYIEASLKTSVSIENINFPVYLRGKVDRVENLDGTTRIIDYKTGNVLQNQLEIEEWDAISTDYDKYSKSFQVLTYATMISQQSKLEQPVEAGIISFKNLRSGFMKFSKKERTSSKQVKHSSINHDILEAFQIELKKLILEICNPEITFKEKEIKQSYGNY